MTPWAAQVSAWVVWLRRPQVVIAAGKAFFAEHQVHSLADLERVVTEKGIDIATLDIDPTTDGAAVVKDGARYILIKPYLHRLRHEFTLAHEVGHHQVHLTDQNPSDVQIGTGASRTWRPTAFCCCVWA